MLRPIATLAATGLAGVVVLKLLGWLLFPLLGVALALAMWVLKLALIAGLIYFGYQLFRRWNDRRGSEAG